MPTPKAPLPPIIVEELVERIEEFRILLKQGEVNTAHVLISNLIVDLVNRGVGEPSDEAAELARLRVLLPKLGISVYA